MTSQLNVDTIVDKAGSGGTNVKVANNAVAVAEGNVSSSTNAVDVQLPEAVAYCKIAPSGNDEAITSVKSPKAVTLVTVPPEAGTVTDTF